MIEDAPDDIRLLDQRDQAQATATPRAREHVEDGDTADGRGTREKMVNGEVDG